MSKQTVSLIFGPFSGHTVNIDPKFDACWLEDERGVLHRYARIADTVVFKHDPKALNRPVLRAIKRAVRDMLRDLEDPKTRERVFFREGDELHSTNTNEGD